MIEVKFVKSDDIPWTTAKLVELSSIGEDDESNFGIAQNGELISFLQNPISPFSEGDLPIDLVFYSLQLYSPSSHLCFSSPSFLFTCLTYPMCLSIYILHSFLRPPLSLSLPQTKLTTQNPPILFFLSFFSFPSFMLSSHLLSSPLIPSHLGLHLIPSKTLVPFKNTNF